MEFDVINTFQGGGRQKQFQTLPLNQKNSFLMCKQNGLFYCHLNLFLLLDIGINLIPFGVIIVLMNTTIKHFYADVISSCIFQSCVFM